jgi:hypothetical protein
LPYSFIKGGLYKGLFWAYFGGKLPGLLFGGKLFEGFCGGTCELFR